jgi:hypothetical protein
VIDGLDHRMDGKQLVEITENESSSISEGVGKE